LAPGLTYQQPKNEMVRRDRQRQATSWFDSEGKSHPYVEVGMWVEPGKFKPRHIPLLPLGENYRLNFVIATTLNDSPLTGGGYHGVTL
jgi:hypothetical protein